MASYKKKDSWMYSDTNVKLDKIPDPKKHQTISFIKSGIRILGYFLLPFNLLIGAGVLILSEIVGIYEELV
jgi:hypothetical protein